jgi:hypothetical protein
MYSEKVQVPRKLWNYLNECRDEDHGDDLKLKRNDGCNMLGHLMKNVLFEYDKYDILTTANFDENSSFVDMIRYLGNYYHQGDEEHDQVEEIHSLFLISVFRKFSLDDFDYTFDNLEPSDDLEVLKQFAPKHLALYSRDDWETNPLLSGKPIHYNHV